MPQRVYGSIHSGALRDPEFGQTALTVSGREIGRSGYKFKCRCGKETPYIHATEWFCAVNGSALALKRGESQIRRCRREFVGGAKLKRVETHSAGKLPGFSRNTGRTDWVRRVSLERVRILPTVS